MTVPIDLRSELNVYTFTKESSLYFSRICLAETLEMIKHDYRDNKQFFTEVSTKGSIKKY